MIRMLYVAGIAHLLRVESGRGESSGPWPSFSARQCYCARHPYAMRNAAPARAMPGAPAIEAKGQRCGGRGPRRSNGLRKEARPAARVPACYAP